MNKITACALIIILIAINHDISAKKSTLHLSGGKVALLVEAQEDLNEDSNKVSESKDSQNESVYYDLSKKLDSQLATIFSELAIDYEVVLLPEFSDTSGEGLNKRTLKKAKKLHRQVFTNELSKSGFTDILSFKFIKYDLNRGYGYVLPVINGIGLYARGGHVCAYHTLSIFHESLAQKAKITHFEIKTNIPEKEKADHVCDRGIDIKSKGITSIKKFEKYTVEEMSIIHDSYDNLLLNSLLDTFYEAGLIEDQISANKLYIKLKISDYLLVEKLGDDEFEIAGKSYKVNKINEVLSEIKEKNKRVKILLGYVTKSKFNFGDIKTFSPIIENSKLTLFRLGPEFQLIEI